MKSRKRLASLLSFLILAAWIEPSGLTATLVSAADDASAPPELGGWVQLSTPEQLAYISANQMQYLNRNIRLMNDIDMSNYDHWTPIGGNDYPGFSGTFDGRGYDITGLTLQDESLVNAGFMGEVSGTIENLGVYANIVGGQHAGAVAGWLNGGTVRYSHSGGSVTGSRPGSSVNLAGGLIGISSNSAIDHSYSTASVTSGVSSNMYAGGLAGELGRGSIVHTYATGSVTNSGGYSAWSSIRSGGLSGNLLFGTVQDSYAAGPVSTVDGGVTTNFLIAGGLLASTGFGAQSFNSYFDREAAGQAEGIHAPAGSVNEAFGRTTAEMKIPATYADWDFEDVWNIHPSVNNGYPYLRPAVLTAELPDAVAGEPYAAPLSLFDGTEQGLTLQTSGLPDGLEAGGDRILRGVPVQPGEYSISITVTDAAGASAAAGLTLTVRERAPLPAGFAAGPGGSPGSTAVTAVPAQDQHAWAYRLSGEEPVRPLVGSPLPEDAIAYEAGADIAGVAAGQYVELFEIDGSMRVQAWAAIRLEASHIRELTQTGTVAGAVYGSGNAPLAGATVTLGEASATTGSDGTFTLSALLPGPGTLRISAPGYYSKQAAVDVAAETTVDAGTIVLSRIFAGPVIIPKPETDTITVYLNGKPIQAAYLKETADDGRPAARIVLDAATLASIYEDGSEAELVVEADEPIVQVDLPAEAVRSILKDRSDAAFAVRTAFASYRVPLKLWLGTEGDIFTMRLAEASEAYMRELSAQTAAQGIRLAGTAVDFTLFTDGRELALGNAMYMERTIKLNPAVLPDSTAVVWVDAEGGLHFVPSVFRNIGERAEAVLYSPHNSMYAVIGYEHSFADLQGHWAKSDVEWLAGKLIVRGVGGDTFAPDRPVTRAEFAAMLTRSLGLAESNGTAAFADANGDAWYAGALGAAVEAGLIDGFPDGSFWPDEAVTREQIFAMIARAIDYAGTLPPSTDAGLERFADRESLAEWARQPAERLLAAELIHGLGEDSLAPKEPATRAQCAVLLKRMLRYLAFAE